MTSHLQKRVLCFAYLIVACILLSGCGDIKKAKKTVKKSSTKLKRDIKDLQQAGKVDAMVYRKFNNIYKAYEAYEKKAGKGPANWNQLREGARMANAETWPIDDAKKEGYTVVWSGKITRLSEDDQWCLLAYDQKAPLNGGWVMLANKTMEKMSAKDFAEFKPLANGK